MRQRIMLIVAVTLAGIAIVGQPPAFPQAPPIVVQPTAFFTPTDRSLPFSLQPSTCKVGLLREICAAKKQILVQEYEFTDQ